MERSERVGYAFAKVETWLEQYAKDNAIYPIADLTGEVGRLLLNGGRTTALEIAKPTKPKTRGRTTASVTPTVKLDSMGRPRTVWEKGKHPYWSSMTKEQRHAEALRRQEVRRQKKVAKESGRPMGGVA